MQEYLLKVSKGAANDVASFLALDKGPTHVRLSTLAPLSNYGYSAGAEGVLLRLSPSGVVTGQDGDDAAPHDFVPWHNVAYMSDGTGLFREMNAKK
jgi:hypothetical protein